MLERLQKIIARAGIASRRHAEELIRSGQVRVNGVVVTELGAKADPEHDLVEAAGRSAARPASASYYLLNKPPHVVSTMADPEGRATLRHVLRGLAGGVFPVGRLDYAASGLILLTSDGQLADTIFKVSSRLVQVYWLKVKGRPTTETLAKVTHQAQARLRLLRAPGAAGGHAENPWYEAELRGARRDLLREALFAAGHPVEKMKRVRLGPLDIGDLAEGHYRQLAPSEVELLRRAVERAKEQSSDQSPIHSAVRPAIRAFERKQWRKSDGQGAGQHVRKGGGGQGLDRSGGARGGREKFAAGAPGPRSGGSGRGEGRPFQPAGGRGGERGFGRGAGRPFQPSGGPSGERSAGQSMGRDKVAPVAPRQGAPGKRDWGADRPVQPDGGRGAGRSFRPSGGRSGERGFGRGAEQGGQRSGRPGGKPGAGRGKFAPGAPRQGVAEGRGQGAGRPFQPRGGRGGDRGVGRGADQGSRPSNHPSGDRDSGRGKCAPRAPRQGAATPGKYRGKRTPGRPGVPPGRTR